jgi:hypothetical protein
MKTTVEIPDALLDEARRVAVYEGSTVRALVEEGLRHVLEEHRRAGAFQLRRATYRGQGLRPELGDGPWEGIRSLAYRGKGQ